MRSLERTLRQATQGKNGEPATPPPGRREVNFTRRTEPRPPQQQQRGPNPRYQGNQNNQGPPNNGPNAGLLPRPNPHQQQGPRGLAPRGPPPQGPLLPQAPRRGPPPQQRNTAPPQPNFPPTNSSNKKWCAIHKTTAHNTMDCVVLRRLEEERRSQQMTSKPNNEQPVHSDPFPDHNKHKQNKDKQPQQQRSSHPESSDDEDTAARAKGKGKGRKSDVKEVFTLRRGSGSSNTHDSSQEDVAVESKIPEISLIPQRQPRFDFNRAIPQTGGKPYSVVEELRTVSAGISLLDVLKSNPQQQEQLLEALGIPTPVQSSADPAILQFDLRNAPQPDPAHIPPFYIAIIHGGVRLHNVIVDEGSSINILPKSTIPNLEVDGSTELSACDYTCLGFEGSELHPIGVMQLPIKLRGKRVTTEFAVIDREFDYNMLLGRPWIAQMQAVVSSLYGQLSFMSGGEIKVVNRVDPPTREVNNIARLFGQVDDSASTESRSIGQYHIADLFASQNPHARNRGLVINEIHTQSVDKRQIHMITRNPITIPLFQNDEAILEYLAGSSNPLPLNHHKLGFSQETLEISHKPVMQEADTQLPPAPPHLEDGNTMLLGRTIDIDIGTSEDLKILKLGEECSPKEIESYT